MNVFHNVVGKRRLCSHARENKNKIIVFTFLFNTTFLSFQMALRFCNSFIVFSFEVAYTV